MTQDRPGTRVAVLGAGLTGLTCAYRLSARSCRVTLYEKEPRPGGLASTLHSGGFAFDYGPHEFCTSDGDLIGLLRELMGERLLVCGKRTAQYFLKTWPVDARA